MNGGYPHRIAFLLMGSLVLSAVSLAHAGGTITGKVTYTGEVPEPKTFQFDKFPNPEFCKKHPWKTEDGKTRLLYQVQVSNDGGLKNAIVSVRDVVDKAWIKNYDGTKMKAVLCEFRPVEQNGELGHYTGVVVNKKNFHVENTDADPSNPKTAKGVLHNPHSFEVLGPRSMTIFNIALAQKGSTLDKMVKLRGEKRGSVFRLQCDQHEYMENWFLPVKNPYYAKTGNEGAFEIKNVPAGEHRVMAWHPDAGKIEATVTVPEGGTVEATFEIKGD